jgi:hypothetical protein
MTKRDLKKEFCYYTYTDMEYGNDIESFNVPSLIGLLEELLDRIETLEKDNEILKSYAWEK